MRVVVAIVLAGALIAASLLIVFRWQISAVPGFIYRLDTWAGTTIRCDLGIVGRIDCQQIDFAR